MNNLLSYCGLFDSKIRASDKDLPVLCIAFSLHTFSYVQMFSADLKKISVQYQVSRCFTGFLQQVTNWKTYRAEKSFSVKV